MRSSIPLAGVLPVKAKSLRRILITAGPTREMLDPVRFITNLSTGEMGYAVAREAKRRGFEVTLISGATPLTPPKGVRFVSIVTVEDLKRALWKHFFRHDALVMAAAVGDFLPRTRALKKVPRQKSWKVTFREAPDLVRRIAQRKGRRVAIGFSLETHDWLDRSRKKLRAKHLDGIVANYFSPRHNPFGKGRVHVALIDARKTRILRLRSKPALAREVLNWVIALAGERQI